MNLLLETKEILRENGKNLSDVLWFGTEEYVIEEDIQKAFDVNYDSGYGGAEISMDLLVVGDGFWLERHEYDGSEWWEYKEQPKKPSAIKRVGGSSNFKQNNKPPILRGRY